MNLANGELLGDDRRQEVLDNLDNEILKTLSKERLDSGLVINACEVLSEVLNEEEHISALLDLGFPSNLAREYLREVKEMLSREYLLKKVTTELGEDYGHVREYIPLYCDKKVREKIMSLGVILHIAAGNADGLPAFSVIEGLLAGNINILKLPQIGDSISIKILMELIKIEPRLSDYIYVFDYSSKEVAAIEKLLTVSDAVVVWGGDMAVSAVRKLAKPDTRIIEWGHKISFAYVTEGGMSDENLSGLAQNICRTNQLLCSSCQGIFLDTESMEAVYGFCKKFINVLERVCSQNPDDTGIGIKAQITLQLYNESLETLYNNKRIYRGAGCSIIASPDMVLEPGIMFRNCWAKPLPRNKILQKLRPSKNHLQTVGLLCAEEERTELSELFSKTGIVRITAGEKMSSIYCGAAHDGEYSLRRYIKIVSVEE